MYCIMLCALSLQLKLKHMKKYKCAFILGTISMAEKKIHIRDFSPYFLGVLNQPCQRPNPHPWVSLQSSRKLLLHPRVLCRPRFPPLFFPTIFSKLYLTQGFSKALSISGEHWWKYDHQKSLPPWWIKHQNTWIYLGYEAKVKITPMQNPVIIP